MKLTFSNGNAKLKKGIYTFALPAGYTCPGASECLAFAQRQSGKIKDGNKQKYRCFSASQEAVYPSARKSRWNNYELIREALKQGKEHAVQLILKSIPSKARMVRIHISGDFFSQEYFDAWLEVCQRSPQIYFYAYTKSLVFWQARQDSIPTNLALTASIGGNFDHLAQELEANVAEVIYHPNQARGIPIDHNDENAYKKDRPKKFALLLHGLQPKGSQASAHIKRLKSEGVEFSYSKKKLEKPKPLQLTLELPE